MAISNPADAQEQEPVVQLCELWVWDDEALPICAECYRPRRDVLHRKESKTFGHEFKPGAGTEGEYRKVLIFLPTDRVLWDPLNPLIPSEHPFHQLALDYIPGYTWGLSQLEQLYPLAAERETVFNDTLERLGKQLDPPIVGVGIQGDASEKLAKLRKKGGTFTTPMGQAKVEPFIVPMPPEAFGAVNELDRMFDHSSGRRSRQREPGMRSGDQVMAEARLGGGPTLSKAMRVEMCAGSIATALLRLKRVVSKTPLVKPGGERFFLSQMPGDFIARVSAHSASPAYAEQLMSKVVFAAQQKWIDGDEGIDMLQLPQAEVLKVKARRRAKQQAKIAEMQMKLKQGQIEAKVEKDHADAESKKLKAIKA